MIDEKLKLLQYRVNSTIMNKENHIFSLLDFYEVTIDHKKTVIPDISGQHIKNENQEEVQNPSRRLL